MDVSTDFAIIRAKLRSWNEARIALVNAPTLIDKKPETLKLWNDLAEAEDELRKEAVRPKPVPEFRYDATNNQIAYLMLTKGTPEQQKEAARYLGIPVPGDDGYVERGQK